MPFALMQLFSNGSQECEAGCCEVVQRYCPGSAAGAPAEKEGHKGLLEVWVGGTLWKVTAAETRRH